MSDDRTGCCKCCGIRIHKEAPYPPEDYRTTVILADQSMMEITICKKCADGMIQEDDSLFDVLWAWECKAWMDTSGPQHNAWITAQLSDNFVLGIMHVGEY